MQERVLVSKEIKEIENWDTITTCDICGEKIIEFNPMGFDVKKTNIECSFGVSYTDELDLEGFKLDVCLDCFLNKIKPLIENEYNVNFRDTEEYC